MSAGLSFALTNSGLSSRIETSNVAPSYTAACWITGSPIALDSDPNSVAPPVARIFTTPSRIAQVLPAILTAGCGPAIGVAVADGVSATVRLWWFDDFTGLWSPLGTSFSPTFAAANYLSLAGGAQIGCKYFVQVTANNGVTKMAALIR